MVRYNSITNATQVNKSGNIAKGPRPNGRKPKTSINKGFEKSAFKSKTNENIISPIENSECVFM
jgi:hypothetical protein